MSKTQRMALLAAAVVVVAAGVVVAVAASGGEDEQAAAPATRATTAEPGGAATRDRTRTETASRPAPRRFEIRLEDGKPVGGRETIRVASGERVRLDVTSDQADEIHVHGYDLEKSVAAGGTARFRFTADDEGIFEIESHEIEHQGKDPLIAELEVRPG